MWLVIWCVNIRSFGTIQILKIFNNISKNKMILSKNHRKSKKASWNVVDVKANAPFPSPNKLDEVMKEVPSLLVVSIVNTPIK